MSFVNKLTKTCRWLRWSTVCAILFYMFFIGLILHSTTYKLQHTLKSRRYHNGQQVEQLQQHQQQQQEQKQKQYQTLSSGINDFNGSAQNVLNSPPAIVPPMPGKPSSSLSLSSSSLSSVASVGGFHGAKDNALLQQHGTSKQLWRSGEPETVIFAASSVNEKQILEKAFRRADRNKDGQLTIQELAVYINHRITEHIDEAIQLNPREFRRVDIAPADGLISWEEYYQFFLKEHGITDADLDEHGDIRKTTLNRNIREDLMRDKARWSEAARSDLFSLTIDEYLSFRHPESSITNLLELVDDLLRQFDQDGDDQLTIGEFSEVNMNDDDDLIRKSLISKTVIERREEFKRIIDKNNDGKADREELLNYVNPKTPRYALQAAATLFSLCDENKDDKLTLNELTTNAEIFLTSKMIDTDSFHTEF